MIPTLDGFSVVYSVCLRFVFVVSNSEETEARGLFDAGCAFH